MLEPLSQRVDSLTQLSEIEYIRKGVIDRNTIIALTKKNCLGTLKNESCVHKTDIVEAEEWDASGSKTQGDKHQTTWRGKLNECNVYLHGGMSSYESHHGYSYSFM